MDTKIALFRDNWKKLDWRVQRMIRDYLRHPTERNACYAVGYIGALNEVSQITDYNYWLAFIGQVEDGVITKTILSEVTA